jgi:putative zinc finger protein
MDVNGFAKMQEFAPKNTTPPSPPQEHWPTAEELAAYIDGTLEKAEAKRITEHLASCEECYAVYSETLHFQLESEPEAGKLVQFPSPRQTALHWWYAAAALLAVCLGLGGYLFQVALVGPVPRLQVAEIVPKEQSVMEPTIFRGDESEPSELDPGELERQSFRVGWLLVNFHVHVRAGEFASASEDWRKIGSLCKDASMSEEAARFFDEANRMSSEAAAPKSPPSYLARAAEREAFFRDSEDSAVYPEYVDFGKWAAAGQAAATAKDRSFFDSLRNQRFLAHLLRGREIQPEPEVRPELQAIAQIWDQGEFGATQFAALERHFKAILDHYDFRS